MKKILRIFGMTIFILLGTAAHSKTLVIGDSLSTLAGNYGSGLAVFLSSRSRDVACVLAVSGSKFLDWTDTQSPLMSHPRFGASQGTYIYDNQNRKVIGEIHWTDKSKVHEWSLSKVLKKPQSVCGDRKSFNHLVVQLGSNENENDESVERYKNVLELAKRFKVKKVNFILAPRNKGKDFKPFNKMAERQIPLLAREFPNLDIGVFNSTENVVIDEEDFRQGDNDHFWKSKSEDRWLYKTQEFLAAD